MNFDQICSVIPLHLNNIGYKHCCNVIKLPYTTHTTDILTAAKYVHLTQTQNQQSFTRNIQHVPVICDNFQIAVLMVFFNVPHTKVTENGY